MEQFPAQRKIVTALQALEKAKKYCALQEHCQSDVRRKLFTWDIKGEKAEWIIGELICDGFINEERYARAFARGKFNIKSWGKQKIKAELKKKNISDYCIQKALSEIDEENYSTRLSTLAVKWLDRHKQETAIARKQKLFRYLASKGYHTSDIWDYLNENKHL